MSLNLNIQFNKSKKSYSSFIVNDMYRELKNAVRKFKEELKGNLVEVISHARFKEIICNSLDSLLIQVEQLTDEGLKASKVKIIYKWFQKKMKLFYDLMPSNQSELEENVMRLPDLGMDLNDECSNNKQTPIEINKDIRSDLCGNPFTEKPYISNQKININKNIENIKKTDNLKKKLDVLFKEPQIAAQKFNSTLSSFDLRSTHYNTRFSSSFRDLNSKDNYINNKAFNNLELQKSLIEEKNRELQEKRSKEEMTVFMNNWGFERGKLKGEIERKQEIIEMIKNFGKKQMSEKEDKNILGESRGNHKSSNNDYYFLNLQKGSLNNNNTIDCDNVKKVMDITTLRESSLSRLYKIVNHNKDQLVNLPLDVSIKISAHDQVLKTRRTYNLINENGDILRKTDNSYEFNPLSFYDNSNEFKLKNSLSINKKIVNKTLNNHKTNLSRQCSSMDLRTSTPNPINMLKLRRTLSTFKTNDVLLLKSELARNNVDIPIEIINSGLLPPKEKNSYEKLFLPNRGYGLLSNPFTEK